MKRLNLTITTACAALLSLTASPSLAQTADSHAAPSHATGTPDVLTPEAQRRRLPISL